MRTRILISLLGLFLPTLLSGEPAPDRKTAPTGFYEGVLLMSAHAGSTVEQSGSLIRHEKSVAGANRVLAYGGVAPLRVLGGASLSPLFVQSPDFSNGSVGFFELEYGWKPNIGIGIMLTGLSQDIRRQEHLPVASTLNGDPAAYLEFTPRSRTFYKDTLLMGNLAYHPVDNSAFDPYISIRGGYGVMEAAYRTEFDYFERWTDPYAEGYATAVGLGLGFNAMLTTEFGLKFEINSLQRFVRSDAFARHTVQTTSATVGFVLNWDNIRRFSY